MQEQASYLTWNDGAPQAEVAAALRNEFLVSRNARTSCRRGGRHPLLGRMYLPAYRAGTNKVAGLRRRYPASQLLPVLYGCSAWWMLTTIEGVAGKITLPDGRGSESGSERERHGAVGQIVS